MKKIAVLILLTVSAFHSFAQEERDRKEEKKGGFKKDHLFTGGGVDLSLSNYTFSIGASPVLGYSINRFLDAGILFSYLYSSTRHVVYDNGYGQYFVSDDKIRQSNFGPGAFVKFYPLRFLFIQAQGEANFIREKYMPVNGPVQVSTISAPSLLMGAGYASGREGVGNLFYYISLSVDVLGDKNSPYVEYTSSGSKNLLPIIRAGIQVPLFQGSGRHRY